jgi:hypothetical protein
MVAAEVPLLPRVMPDAIGGEGQADGSHGGGGNGHGPGCGCCADRLHAKAKCQSQQDHGDESLSDVHFFLPQMKVVDFFGYDIVIGHPSRSFTRLDGEFKAMNLQE